MQTQKPVYSGKEKPGAQGLWAHRAQVWRHDDEKSPRRVHPAERAGCGPDAMGRASRVRRERQSRLGFPGLRRPAGPASSPARETGGASVRVSGGAWGLSRFRRAALSALLGLAAFAAAPQGASADPCPGDIVPPGTFWSACMTPEFQDNRIQTLSGYRRTADYGRLSDITVDSAAGTLTVQILTYTFSKLANSREIRIDFLGDESHSAPPSVTAGWKLHIGSYTYALDSNAHNVSRQYSSYNWDAAGPIWTEGQKITVILRVDPARRIGGRVVRAGLPFLYVLKEDTFKDPVGAGLTYSAALEGGAALPDWLTFDPDRRTLRGTPTNADATGPDERIFVVFAATDGNGGKQRAALSIGVVPDTGPPVIQSVSKASGKLVLTYNEPLDEDSEPGAGAFAVTDGGNPATVSSVDVSGRTVVLTLASALTGAAQVSYTVPTGANATPIRDVAGTNAAAFSNKAASDYVIGVRALQGRVSEGAGSAGFEISLDPVPVDPKVAFFVHWETVPGTAVPHWLSQTGADYTATGGGIALGNGGGSKPTHRVWVPIADDGLDEPDETFGLRIALGFGPDQTDIVNPTSAPAYVKDLAVSVDTAEAEVTIEDNDSGPSVTLRAPGGRLGDDIREGDEEAAFGVWLLPGTGSVSYPVTVNYAVRALTAAEAAEADGRTRATAGTDFTAATGMVTFNTGETHKGVPVHVPRTPELEGDEYFAVELSGPSGNLDIEESLGLYLIYDNPGPYKSRMGVGSGAPPESEGGGCGVNLWVEFRDGNGERTQVSSLAATDFAVENGRIGAPAADADGLRWTVPAWSTAGFTGLMRVRLVEKEQDPEGRLTAWEAAEQVLRVAGDDDCAAVARNALASLALEGLELDPAFDVATTAYTATAPEDTQTVTVTASAVYGTSDVAFTPADADTDAEGHQVALAEGGTGIAVTVTPGDGSAAQTYTVTVTGTSGSGVLTGFVLVDASNDADLGAVESGGTVTASAIGRYGVRAEVEADAEVGSVVLTLAGPGADDTHSRTENIAPWSLYGDDGQGAEHGRALAAGSYTLTATAYAESGGAGDVLGTLTVPFTVEVEAAPGVLTGFVLVDAATDADLGAIADGGTVSVSTAGRYGIRAEVEAGAEVGSVVLSLAGPGAGDTHERTENVAPWSLYGDAGGAEHGRALAVGSYTLTATAYAQRRGAGAALGVLTVPFTVAASTAPLTASLENLPERHDGATAFSFELRLSEHVPVLGYKTVRDAAFTVTGGEVTAVGRIAAQATDRNRRWEITVEPDSFGDLTVTLPATTDCAAEGAVCHTDGRMLSAAASGTVPGPALSVADAQAEEGTDATLDFAVTLVPARTVAVTVAYATADGTATAGSDYTATSGTLTFAAGDTEKTIAVPVLNDDINEGSETLTLTLTSASGATLADAEATGTISNSDPMPKAWLARFGRTAAIHVVDALEARLDGGAGGSWGQLGGHRLGGGGMEAVERLEPDLDLWDRTPVEDGAVETVTMRDLLLGTAFHLASEDGDSPGRPRLSVWGRVASSGFDGREDELRLDGTVTTATLGVDGTWGRWLAGAMLAYSRGKGSFSGEASEGDLDGALTGLHPYAVYRLGERLQVWALLGYGGGSLRLRLADQTTYDTDLEMRMGAVGVRAALREAPATGGVALALRSDALWVQTASAAVTGLAESEADVSRVRLILEASRPFALGGGSFVPSLELGVRHDGGDAERGSGVEAGGSLRYASAWGLSIEASLRGLLAHEDRDYGEWGVSGALRFEPGSGGRGLRASIVPTWGTAASGVSRLWGQPTTAGLAPESALLPAAAGRVDAELAYGLAALKGRGLLTPYARVALTEGSDQAWHLGARLELAETLDLSLEASRRASEGEKAAHELALLATLPF